jgi:hypothetical protein
MTFLSRPRDTCVAIVAVLLGGCTLSQAEVGPEGALEVFSRTSLSHGTTLPDDWVIEADGGAAQSSDARANLNIDTASTTGAILTLKTGPDRFVLARRTKATLLASPYIGWSWQTSTQPGHESDIRMIIGFQGGSPDSRSGSEPLAHLGTSLPPFDRAISILWGDSALERGSFSTLSEIPEYIARGGPEHQEKWWTDNLDLADLYRKAWPSDHLERTRIVFVGFAVTAGPGAAQTRFGDIVLYR